jgi:23S rRNA (pseudouridine1915-N3)-methyltransferase
VKAKEVPSNMIIRIIAVGKLKERYWQDGTADYIKRINAYTRLELLEVPESRIPENASPKDEEQAMSREAIAILHHLSKREGLVVALDRQGRSMDSLKLAKLIEEKTMEGIKETAWIIGGPLGLAPELIKRADLVISFSELTFPHQMMRLILLEQIYRCYRIIYHEPYHK